MDISLHLGQWYVAADGGTIGGDLVDPHWRGPFAGRPRLAKQWEETMVGPLGEAIAIVSRSYLVDGRCFTLSEHFWVSPRDGQRVKLVERLTESSYCP